MFRVDKFGEKYLVHSLCKVVLIGENGLEKFMSNIFKKQLEKIYLHSGYMLENGIKT